MLRRTLLIATILATPLSAQDAPVLMGNEHNTKDHGSHMGSSIDSVVVQPGQGAFAAIEEITLKLVADPNTDWASVDIDGLREHLRDMDLVFIDAEVVTESVVDGLRFTVTGEGRVREAIRNMAIAHSGVMNGVDGWHYEATKHPEGASMTIIVPPADLAKLTALGFFGVMATGMHHQDHHWMMATGASPHN